MTAANAPDAGDRIRTTVVLDLEATLAIHRRGFGDPTIRIERSRVLRATRTPQGPASESIERTTDGLLLRAWGPGAGWLVEHAPALLGLHDDPSALVVDEPLLRDLSRRFAGLRIGRTDAVMEALVPALLEQKVTGEQARRGFRGLVSAFGEPAPGPLGLRLPPASTTLAGLPYHALHPFEIERHRAELVRRAARLADRLEATTSMPLAVAYARLRSIRGIGPWTTAEVGARAYGDPDAVSVGDYHLANLVCWALAREPRGTDERMLELLEPYRGQRGRVVRLLEASGMRAPMRGPRMAARSIARD